MYIMPQKNNFHKSFRTTRKKSPKVSFVAKGLTITSLLCNENELMRVYYQWIEEDIQKYITKIEEDIQKYITKSPAKSCLLDPIPTWFIKQNVSTFVPIITQIVNSPLSTGTFPESLKHAVISPVIKKQSLNPHELKNYRPVSNIPYLSKIIERHAVDNIARHMTENNLGEPLQSAYRPAHSTESVLLKVKCDIMEFVSQRKGVFLALLDLSAAFDTVNHEILLLAVMTKT